jgi:acylphosphatase
MVHYRGNVQGVGFRYTARRIARGYAVTGYVRNLADGRVELAAEGPADQVQSFLEELQRTMAQYIRHSDVQTLPATGKDREFEIRS